MVSHSGTRRQGGVRWVAASLLAHGLLLGLALRLSLPHALAPPVLHVVNVDLVPPAAPSPAQPNAPVPMAEPATPQLAPPADPPTPTTDAAGGAASAQQAVSFYAAGILADPANAALRRVFGTLGSDEQLIQLCNMEALEQLGRRLGPPRPDTVVGYAFGDMDVSGSHLVAQGGAYRRQRLWYRLQYDCTAAPDRGAVTAFAFTPGPAVPQSAWDEHFLNADDEGLDP